MTTKAAAGASSPPPGAMSPLGVSSLEETVYRFLLEAPSSLARVVRAVDAGTREVRTAVQELQAKGLVGLSAHQPPLFVAVSPELAIDGLLSRKREELDAARALATQLVGELRQVQARVGAPEIVEIISGRDAIVQRVDQMQRGTKRAICIFDTPPYAAGGGQNLVELDLLRQGIRYRVVYDRAALEWPGQMDQLTEVLAGGEEARMVERLPLKLAISDDSAALLPLSSVPDPSAPPLRILVHPSPLLDALVALFERVWDQATAIRSPRDPIPIPEEDAPALSEVDRKLLLMVSSGFKADAIARQLGITRRTVQRRIQRLMEAVGASSRAELILVSARRGIV